MADTASKQKKNIYILLNKLHFHFILSKSHVYIHFNILQKPFPVASFGSCTPREK